MKVEQKKCLGIYLGRNHAVAVLLSARSGTYTVSDCFSVSAETDEDQNSQLLGRLLAEACTQRKLNFTDVTVALDCDMFTQHNLHSEFADRKQIAQTVKFDAEDALTIDVSNLAVTFNITSTDGLPLAMPALRMFSLPSMTSPTSDRRTAAPLR